jgi:hypothetical protein
MTIQLIHQIQSAERGFTTDTLTTTDPRFTPSSRSSLREAGARLIRSSANQGLRLADRIDPHCQPA